MYRIIGGDGREYGPVTTSQIGEWIAQGRANGSTKARGAADPDWKPLAEFPEFAPALGLAAGGPPPLPAETAPADLPVAESPSSQSVPEPAPTNSDAPASDPAEEAYACAGRDYRLSVTESYSRGWDIMTDRFWLTVGGTVLGFLSITAAGMLPLGLGFIAQIAVQHVVYAGVFWLLLQVARGREASCTDVFVGFTRSLPDLLLLSVVMTLANFLLMLLAAAPLFAALYRDGVFSGNPPVFANLVGPILLLPVLAIPSIYLSVAWVFAPILVIDRGLSFREALSLSRRAANRRWFRLFFICLAYLPLLIAGLICFLVGAFVAMTLFHAAIASAYRSAFPDRPAGTP